MSEISDVLTRFFEITRRVLVADISGAALGDVDRNFAVAEKDVVEWIRAKDDTISALTEQRDNYLAQCLLKNTTIATLTAKLASQTEGAANLQKLVDKYGRIIIGEALFDDVPGYGIWKASWRLLVFHATLDEAMHAAMLVQEENK